jgi:probable rRNA maturation factor
MIHISRRSALPEKMSLSDIRLPARVTLKRAGSHGDLTVVLTDNRTIKNLNREYRKIDSITDVLSFQSDEVDPQTNIRYLGDIIISVEKANEQAKQNGRSFFDEMTMLIVHGCLHLAGYDHASNEERESMRRIQEDILSSLGIANYAWPEDS